MMETDEQRQARWLARRQRQCRINRWMERVHVVLALLLLAALTRSIWAGEHQPLGGSLHHARNLTKLIRRSLP